MPEPTQIDAVPRAFSALLDPDREVRSWARARQRDTIDRVQLLTDRQRGLWLAGRDGSGAFADRHLEREWRSAVAAMAKAKRETLQGAATDFYTPSARTARTEACALLFLRWEAERPEDWRRLSLWSPWGTKKQILAAFRRAPLSVESRPVLVELVLSAAARIHRCEDRGYARLVRDLDGPHLREGLTKVARNSSQPGRQRAGYLLALLDHPSTPATVYTWRSFQSMALP